MPVANPAAAPVVKPDAAADLSVQIGIPEGDPRVEAGPAAEGVAVASGRAVAVPLPGIPTIRVFEALACGIPLVSAPWDDAEQLFRPGADYLVARDGAEMREHLRALLADPAHAAAQAARGLDTIRARHTCAHRVDELFAILAEVAPATAPQRLSQGA